MAYVAFQNYFLLSLGSANGDAPPFSYARAWLNAILSTDWLQIALF